MLRSSVQDFLGDGLTSFGLPGPKTWQSQAGQNDRLLYPEVGKEPIIVDYLL